MTEYSFVAVGVMTICSNTAVTKSKSYSESLWDWNPGLHLHLTCWSVGSI